jgi:ribosomal protein S18 acetylase RimI-like enzyme
VSSTVRPATEADARAIAEIRVETWRATYAGIVPQSVLDRMDVDRTVEGICGILASDTRVLVVDTPDSGVAGYTFVAPARDDDAAGLGEIEAIYVRPDAQGRGLGGQLLAASAEDLAALGFDTLVLWVLTDNAPARGFYEHAGFVPDGTARTLDFDGESIEEIRYRRGPAGPK